MALLFIDGFDHYGPSGTSATSRINELNPSDYSSNNTSGFGATASPVLQPMPELGGQGIRLFTSANQSSNNNMLAYKLPYTPTSGDTIGVGCHLYSEGWPTDDRKGYFLGFGSDSGSVTGVNYLGFRCNGVTGLVDFISAGSVVGSFSSALHTTEVIHHVEIKVLFHASEGTVELRVNGQTEYAATDLNTLAGVRTHVRFMSGWAVGATQQYSCFYDNFYVWDGTGDKNNDWLGERNVYTLVPVADTAQADWTLSTGSDGWALLDNIPPVPSTDYIESATQDESSAFTMGNLPSLDITPIGVQVTFQGSKTGTSDTEISTGPVGYVGSGHPQIQDNALYYHSVFDENPDTGLDWLPGEISGMDVEIKRTV